MKITLFIIFVVLIALRINSTICMKNDTVNKNKKYNRIAFNTGTILSELVHGYMCYYVVDFILNK